MAKAEMDMIRDILGWPLTDEQKLALISQIVGGKAAQKPTAKAPAKAAPKAVVKAPAKAAKKKRASRKAARSTRRSQLWNELKRLAPDKAKSLSYTKLDAGKLEKMVEEAKKA